MKLPTLSRVLALLCSLVVLSACGEKDDPVAPYQWPTSDHTLLIYMVGDNNLSPYCAQNTLGAIEGLLDSDTPLNLVIYEDSESSGAGRRGTPVLFSLTRNGQNRQKVDTTYIKRYDNDWNSADPAIMRQVIADVFTQYDTEVKGLELWSHALGWIPSADFHHSQASAPAPATRANQYFGIDGNDQMELWELREVLEQGPHLDYVIFDACNMGLAEVAYELRNAVDYLVACPTEIMSAGLPYSAMVKSLSTCTGSQTRLPALQGVVDGFAHLYPGDRFSGERVSNGGTISLTDLRQMSKVRASYLGLLQAYPERVKLLEEHPYTYEDELLHFGRSSVGSRYYFYDMLSAARFYADADTLGSSYTQLAKALSAAVVSEYHTQGFLELNTSRSCGLGVSLPELFQVSTDTESLRAAYAMLQWSQD